MTELFKIDPCQALLTLFSTPEKIAQRDFQIYRSSVIHFNRAFSPICRMPEVRQLGYHMVDSGPPSKTLHTSYELAITCTDTDYIFMGTIEESKSPFSQKTRSRDVVYLRKSTGLPHNISSVYQKGSTQQFPSPLPEIKIHGDVNKSNSLDRISTLLERALVLENAKTNDEEA